MLKVLRKITALVLLVILASAGIVAGADHCSLACEHSFDAPAKLSCCMPTSVPEQRMAHGQDHDASPCADGSFCDQPQSSHESLLPSSLSLDLFLVSPIEVPVIAYEQSVQRLTDRYHSSPDVSPPIYKLYCSYLH